MMSGHGGRRTIAMPDNTVAVSPTSNPPMASLLPSTARRPRRLAIVDHKDPERNSLRTAPTADPGNRNHGGAVRPLVWIPKDTPNNLAAHMPASSN